jgi:hypothetical protein
MTQLNGGAEPSATETHAEAPVGSTSHYVRMRDGVRLALDLLLPRTGRDDLATLVVFTRYWRSFARPPGALAATLQPVVAMCRSAGHAFAVVDTRGSGASFGSRPSEWSPEEVADCGDVFDWICAQPWSNGRIATIGTSYPGNSAELAAVTDHTALVATVPRFTDHNEYRHAFRPGGVANRVIGEGWTDFVRALDRNDGVSAARSRDAATGPDWTAGVRPVGDQAELRSAVAEHAANADLATIAARLEFSDDPFGAPERPELTLETISPSGHAPALAASTIPAMHWASWFDGGTAEGVLERFASRSGPMHIIIGAWDHGGNTSADPFGAPGGAPEMSVPDQHDRIASFLQPLLRGDGAVPDRVIEYFTVGEGQWRRSDRWPPRDSQPQRLYLSSDGRLSAEAPEQEVQLSYTVDQAASTGPYNRWTTQLGAKVDYGDLSREAPRRLMFETNPLDNPVELTGTPVVELELSSTREDGALFAYLEAVSPDGRVTFLTDGVRRLLFAGRATDPDRGAAERTSFTRREARPYQRSQRVVLRFRLNPLSAVVPADHRIRLSFAGADAGTFAQLPGDGAAAIWSVLTGGANPGHIELPVLSRYAQTCGR